MSKEKARKHIPSIRGIMLGYVTVFISSLIIILGLAIGIAVTALLGKGKESFVYEIIILSAVFIVVLVGLILTNIRVYKLCYKKLYFTSKDIVNDISLNKNTFNKFPKHQVKEFDELNHAIEKTENHLKRSIVYSRTLDYTSLGLELSNTKLGTITFDSLNKNIQEIVMLSQAYRNAFLLITYGEKLSNLVGQSELEIIKQIRRIFDYENVIVADNSDQTGYILYIPQIDSMNRLKEEVEIFIKNTSMVKNTPEGKALCLARTSVVIYPFSDIPDIISDLRYANRQGMSVNFYLPDRVNKANNDTVMHGSFSLNRSNQLVTNLAAIRIHNTDRSDMKKQIRNQLNTFAAYINADYTGVIIRDDRINKFYNYIAIKNIPEVYLRENDFVDPGFLNAINTVADDDGSYYFSSRSHLNTTLGNYLDKMNLTSGYFFVIKDDKDVLGLVYFTNYKKKMDLDSYLRESAFSISYQIGAVIQNKSNYERLTAAMDRSDIIMKLSNYILYGVDKDTHELLFTSKTFEDAFGPNKKKPCYKTLYNYDEPCKDCPIVTKQKMLKTHKSIQYETSLALNSEKNHVVRMLVKPVEEEGKDTNRFDKDFLLNSYKSLINDMNNIYSIQGKGYVLIFGIENYKKLLKAYGSEGYITYVRKFVDYLNDHFVKENRFYLYDNSKIAMVIPNSGRSEIISICEKVFEISKKQIIELDDNPFIPLEINYLAFKYPQEYPTHADLLRHAEAVVSNYDHKKHIDEIFFEGNKYYRNASHAAFINEVIDKQFKDKTFKVNLQPMVNMANKHIEGAEILIRLSDDYQNQQLSAFEVIKVAGETNKIGIITEALMDYIGELYQKQASSIFRLHNFNLLSLNTDYSYFSDEGFIKKITAIMNRYAIPGDFLSFEINEKELGDHFEEFKPIIAKVKSLGIHISVDQYTGRFVSLNKVKDLGFEGIKIPRNMIKDIDVNKANLNALTDLIKLADSFELKVTLVGVENKDQYTLIREITNTALIQGFYFYAPLELPRLIEAIRVN